MTLLLLFGKLRVKQILFFMRKITVQTSLINNLGNSDAERNYKAILTRNKWEFSHMHMTMDETGINDYTPVSKRSSGK